MSYKLDGFYKGSLDKLYPQSPLQWVGRFVFPIWLPWYGKEFDSKSNMGNNHVPKFLKSFAATLFGESVILGETGNALRVFPFKTSRENALKDPKTMVLRLNYDIPQNPPQIRAIVDELVEVNERHYSGKAYTKKGNDVVLTALFSLRK